MSCPRVWDELVVGADGFLGSALLRRAGLDGATVIGTSRRSGSPSEGCVPLDLAQAADAILPPALTLYLCAAVTGFDACARQPEQTRAINVEGLLRVARQAHSAGAFLVLPSTSAVFPGTDPHLPLEATPTEPTTVYGRQKAELEQRLLDLDGQAGRVAILRLTKVLAATQPVVQRILSGLRAGGTLEAYRDLRMAPISRKAAIRALRRLGQSRQGGIFHLSGEAACSYADLARALAVGLGVDPERIQGIPAPTAPPPAFMPSHPGLAMARSLALLGPPQPLSQVVGDLLVDQEVL